MDQENGDQALTPQYKPYYYELEEGKSYFWCSCGRSASQPFCDGSHKGTSFEPVRYQAKEQGEEVLFCGCKRSADQPFCDGAHNDLKEEYDSDDPNSPENLAIPVVAANERGQAILNGGCFVLNTGRIALEQRGPLGLGKAISSDDGAQHQSVFYAEVTPGRTEPVSFGDSHVVALSTSGAGVFTISGESFDLAPNMGFYVRPGEVFAVENSGEETIKLVLAVCHQAERADFPGTMPDNFNRDFPLRSVGIDPDKRHTMADRFFQMLVDKTMGSTVVTQFIGDIPLSKAAMHRHLYEESIVVLQGEGCMWTEDGKAVVRTGDIIFLPRKQVHSLECTDPAGMTLAGVIYPGDNPSINY